MSNPRILASVFLLSLLLSTGCGNKPAAQTPPPVPTDAAGNPLAPVSSGLTPTSTASTAVSTASTSPTTGTTGALTAGTPSAPVTLVSSDTSTGSGADANGPDAIGTGLIISAASQPAKDFRAGAWARLTKKYTPRVNFWILSVDTPVDREQAVYLGWKGELPTMVVTRGKAVIQLLPAPNEASADAALGAVAPK